MPLWRGKNKFTYLELTPSGVLQGMGRRPMGNFFYVDGNAGSDTSVSQGKSPATPFKTIAHALDQCTDYHDDYIIVLDHYVETFPISVDVASVHIIAAGPYNIGWPMVYLTSASDCCFQIAADFVEIAGFEFGSGASNAAIEWTATKGYGRIHHCSFGRMQTGQDGIKNNAPYDAVEMIIDHCIFGPGLTRYGIFLDHNMTRGLIEDNIFQKVTNIAIKVDQMADGIIRRNRFMLPSDTAGYAITLAAACSGMYISENQANFGGTDSMGTVPWVVTGGAGDGNTWDNNKTAGVVDYPE